MTLGKKFASPIKQKHPKAKRAKVRETNKTLVSLRSSMTPPVRSSTLVEMPVSMDVLLTTPIGQQLETNYKVHELPSEGDSMSDCPSSACLSSSVHDSSSTVYHASSQAAEVLVNTALLARIESLEAENHSLKHSCNSSSSQLFRIEQIQENDQLVRFYTGFVSYFIFITFFEFLGPAVNNLNYWGTKQKDGSRQRHRYHKLDPKNQFFLTLVKLRLNLKVRDLAFRFGISTGYNLDMFFISPLERA